MKPCFSEPVMVGIPTFVTVLSVLLRFFRMSHNDHCQLQKRQQMKTNDL
jgi:hypothetical protein